MHIEPLRHGALIEIAQLDTERSVEYIREPIVRHIKASNRFMPSFGALFCCAHAPIFRRSSRPSPDGRA